MADATQTPRVPPPSAEANAVHDQPCPECSQNALTVITVDVWTSKGPQAAGGWAYCLNAACEATPHPVMETDRG